MGSTEARSSSLDFTEIAQLADQGMVFVGCKLGMSSSRWLDWQNRATNNKFMLLDWIKGGSSLVTVARHGHSFVLDLDDPAACERLGFKREWLNGYYAVDTPSGGEHHHGLHDAATDTLGNVINVYRVKGDKSSGKILEVKLNSQSVAAPTAERSADEKKCAGIYQPRLPGAKMRRGIDPELLAWLEKYGEVSKPHEQSGATRVDFHPQFEREAFLGRHDCTEDKSGIVDGALHVVVESCPVCGREARDSTVAAGITKFIFGGYSYGFVCHACGVNTKEELEERLAELGATFEPWNEFVYKDDDPEFLLSSFGAADASLRERVEELASQPPDRIFPLTDMGNAERFEKRFAGRFAWTKETGWLAYRGGVWQEDKTGEADRAMQTTVRLITEELRLIEAGETEEEKNRASSLEEAIVGWAKASESNSKINAALERASNLKPFAKDYADFEQRPNLFNCGNGTIDLNTGEFREHDPDDLLLKKSPVAYDPSAKCPNWEKFLLEVQGGDRELVEYLQRCCGYSMSAECGEQCLFIPWGTGGTGKGTYLTVIGKVLGTYAATADPEMFIEKHGDSGQPFEMAGMEGVRVLLAVETDQGKRLAEAKIKRMTGNDSKIRACRKHKDQYDFTPVWKVWLATNHRPNVRGTDDSIWDRPKLIPFDVRFRNQPNEVKNLADILLQEASGILNWMLEGYRKWKSGGLRHPAKVSMLVKDWRENEDFIGRFLEERVEEGEYVEPGTLFGAFTNWAENVREGSRMNASEFKEQLERRGYVYKKSYRVGTKVVRAWVGIKLKTSTTDPQIPDDDVL